MTCQLVDELATLRARLQAKAAECDYSEPLPNDDTLCGDGTGILTEYYQWLADFKESAGLQDGETFPDPGPPGECDTTRAYITALSDYAADVSCADCPEGYITYPPDGQSVTVGGGFFEYATVRFKRATRVAIEILGIDGVTWTEVSFSVWDPVPYSEDWSQRSSPFIPRANDITFYRFSLSNDNCVFKTVPRYVINNYSPPDPDIPCTPGARQVIMRRTTQPGDIVDLTPYRTRGRDFSTWELISTYGSGPSTKIEGSGVIRDTVLVGLPNQYVEDWDYGVQLELAIIC